MREFVREGAVYPLLDNPWSTTTWSYTRRGGGGQDGVVMKKLHHLCCCPGQYNVERDKLAFSLRVRFVVLLSQSLHATQRSDLSNYAFWFIPNTYALTVCTIAYISINAIFARLWCICFANYRRSICIMFLFSTYTCMCCVLWPIVCRLCVQLNLQDTQLNKTINKIQQTELLHVL